MDQLFLKENPNPSAKAAFIIWTLFHYYVYKNIAKHLPEAEFVVCDTWFKNKDERGTDHLESAATFFSGRGVPYRIMPELDNKVLIEKFFEKYEVIVATFPWPPLDSLSFDDWFSKKKSVRMMDGTTKNLATFAPWSARFDLALTYGPHSQKYLEHLNEAHMVGLPKFDDWFNKTLEVGKIQKIKESLDPNKKTILYLPTHSGLSSLYKFGDAVLKLSEHYNILTKFHHWSGLTDDKTWFDVYKNHGSVKVFDEKDDIMPLYFLADVILSDNSSGAFEAILTDKPLVILDVTTDAELVNRHYTGEEFNGLWYSGRLLPRESIYKQMKNKYQIGEIVIPSEDLGVAVGRAETSVSKYNEARRYWRQLLFAHNDGRCGERAAAVISKFIAREKPTPPLLAEAIRAYFVTSQNNYRYQMQKILADNKSLKSEVNFNRRFSPILKWIDRNFPFLKNYFNTCGQ